MIRQRGDALDRVAAGSVEEGSGKQALSYASVQVYIDTAFPESNTAI